MPLVRREEAVKKKRRCRHALSALLAPWWMSRGYIWKCRSCRKVKVIKKGSRWTTQRELRKVTP